MRVPFRRVGKTIDVGLREAWLEMGGRGGSVEVQLAVGVCRERRYGVSGSGQGGRGIVGLDGFWIRGVMRRRVMLAVMGGIGRLDGRHLGSGTLGHRGSNEKKGRASSCRDKWTTEIDR